MKRFVAYHVGRRGEVAGGMTQVVNGYLDWDFPGFRTDVIVSRDGTKGARAALIAARAVLRILRLRGKRRSVAVVHLSGGGSFVREGGLLVVAHLRGIPTVAHLHGSQFAAFARSRPKLVALVLTRADLVISLSDESTRVARGFVPHDRVRLVPNAVPPAAGDVEKLPTIVFGGAVSRRKGVDTLGRAWAALVARGGDGGWTLQIAGPVIDRSVVPTGVEGIRMMGALDHDDLMTLLESSSIAVLPSRDEAMPMFLLEAMARSNAVVSTPVGGIPELLSDGAGRIIDPEDADALASALEVLISDEHERSAAAGRARARFDESYSAAAVFPRIERAWMDAIERAQSR